MNYDILKDYINIGYFNSVVCDVIKSDKELSLYRSSSKYDNYPMIAVNGFIIYCHDEFHKVMDNDITVLKYIIVMLGHHIEHQCPGCKIIIDWDSFYDYERST